MTSTSFPHLLLVDDDISILRLLEKVLKKSLGDAITMESVVDARDAIARIDQGDVELLITDLEMPGVSGLDLLQRAKKQKPCTQVILLTGSTDSDSLLDALEMGANDYLVKPVDLQMLEQLVSEALQRLSRWKQALRETWAKKRIAERILLQSVQNT
jgi:two-component system nitrogen regulation response regulator NtrX